MVYRKGRLDEVWATDLPTVAERVEIFSIHLRKRKRDPEKFKVELLAKKTPDFTGAEIEGCIEDAMFTAFDKDEEIATEHVLASISETVPQAKRNREELEAIREWAATRARKVAGGEPAEQSPAGKKSKVRNIHIKKK
jgi:SpoVK/Ycf46/Vps4 family AAA+-type ATPase